MPAASARVSLKKPSLQGVEHSLNLWVLIALELLAMAHLRNSFRRHHGG